MNKDYTLLRPFDAEKAKAGEPICYYDASPRTLAAVPDSRNDPHICVKSGDGRLGLEPARHFRMAPLAWVDGKPVYKGDVLYRYAGGYYKTVTHVTKDKDGCEFLHFAEGGNCYLDGDNTDLTWTPPAPKVKRHQRWLNLYANGTFYTFDSKEAADICANDDRVECRLIEWEVKK